MGFVLVDMAGITIVVFLRREPGFGHPLKMWPVSLPSPRILSAHVNTTFSKPCVPLHIAVTSMKVFAEKLLEGWMCVFPTPPHPTLPAQACGGNAAAAGSRKVVLNSFLCLRDFRSVSPTSQERSLTRKVVSCSRC